MDCSKWSSKVKKTGLSRPLYLYFLSFPYHAVDRLRDKLLPDGGIRTEDYWCGKWLLSQLSHNHWQFKSKVHSSHLTTEPWVKKVGISSELIYLSILYSRPGAHTEAWSINQCTISRRKDQIFSQILAEKVENMRLVLAHLLPWLHQHLYNYKCR